MPLPAENLLADATSPYLIQHKDNPVHWREWTPETLAEAKALDKPILLSVGYAACHWCHVMAHESFEDDETAILMNALFVNVKVDREERPDIDQIYMSALHALGEQGGWPLTMFLTPDAEPFWGGTYFPKEPRFGRPSFKQVLEAVAHGYRERKETVRKNADAILGAIAARPKSMAVELDAALLDRAADALLNVIDRENGGVRGAPKFPQASLLDLLWRAWRRRGDPRFRDATLLTLEKICLGGIYDHLGGGFSRYSVDERWLAPHFEKMLYDNAQLIERLTHAWLETGAPLFRQRIEETIEWAVREMRQPGGAFAASLDADSEGEEGKFYVWTIEEIEAVLKPDDAAFFAALYDVSKHGNWEHVNILNLLESGPIPSSDATRAASLRNDLLNRRAGRVRPGLDDKILADWNGLTIVALARAATAFDRPNWLALAEEAFAFVAGRMGADGRLAHAERSGRLTRPGLSSDYANMIHAALALHEASGDPSRLDAARGWAQALHKHHWIEERGAYALAADDSEGVILRMSNAGDEAIPSANSLAAEALVKLWLLTGEDVYRERADRLFATFAGDAAGNAFAHAGMLNAFDSRLAALQVVVVSPEGRNAAKEILKGVWSVSNPARVVSVVADDPEKTAIRGQPTVYVCRGQTCSLPLIDVESVLGELQA